MIEIESINKDEFCELCKFVCCQLRPSGSQELDRETLNFAIYWQVCNIFDEKVLFKKNSYSKIMDCRQHLQDLLDFRITDSFNVLQIVDMNIDESVSRYYEKRTGFALAKFDYPTILSVDLNTI